MASNPRIEMAWLLYCANQGWAEVDRIARPNWMAYDLPKLHPDELSTRNEYLLLADEALSMLREHLAGVSTLLRGLADDRKPGPVSDLAYKKADLLDDLLGVGSYVE